MKKTFSLIMLTLFLTGSLAHAQDVSKVGITAAPFLEIGVGARAIGMGGAFVGTADDASALYWNVAGIARIPDRQFFFMHSDWFADINFEYAGFVLPLGTLGTLGLAVTGVNYGNMPVRTIDRPQGTGEIFQASDLAIAASYARGLTDRFSIGFNIKMIQQRIWHERATGFAFDFGSLFVTGLKGMRIGASLSNFGTDMNMNGKDLLVYHDVDPYIIGNNDRIPANLETADWPLPLIFQFGIAFDPVQNDMNRLTMAIDALHPNDNTESLNIGIEYGFRELLFLRAGWRDLGLRDAEQGITFGAGFATRLVGTFNAQLDYAYADFGRLESVQRFSFLLSF